jgi:hypothetical protein
MPDSPTANMFVIEGEDFNTGGGQIIAAVNTMPYTGAAYDGLSAVKGTDYDRGDSVPDGNIYRLGETPNVPHSLQNDENGTVRARDAAGAAVPEWTLTTNYRLGWAGGGSWMNYTRNIPAGDYQIWASQSFGETPGAAIQTRGNLFKVTSDPTQGSQTTENIGYFRGPATGGWGANQLFPLRTTTATSGDAAVVALGGATPTTLRFEYESADFDYLMLVKVGGGVEPPQFAPVVKNTDGSLTISWTGGGVLEVTTSLEGTPVWQEVAGATSPYTFTPSAAAMFGRIRQ